MNIKESKELCFRALTKTDGRSKLVFGNLYNSNDGKLHIISSMQPTTIYDVISNIVDIYTGFKDITSMAIFTNDLVVN